jgi:hypothetical protein
MLEMEINIFFLMCAVCLDIVRKVIVPLRIVASTCFDVQSFLLFWYLICLYTLCLVSLGDVCTIVLDYNV